MLASLTRALSALEAMTRTVVGQRCGDDMLVVLGAGRIVLRVCIGIVRIVVRRAWLMAMRRSRGSDTLHSLLLLKKVRGYLVEPGNVCLHIDMAEIVFRSSFFVFRVDRAAVSVRRVWWSGIIGVPAVAKWRRTFGVDIVVGGHLLVCTRWPRVRCFTVC